MIYNQNVYFYLKNLTSGSGGNDGVGSIKPTMAVVIQLQINSKASGVMFTINANNGALSEFTVESVFGQGEGYVSGNLKPDKYLIRKKDGKVLMREIVMKEFYYDLVDTESSNNNIFGNKNDGSKWIKKVLPRHLKHRSSLTHKQLKILLEQFLELSSK